MQTLSKKICLVGDYAVGKTSLVRRFVDRQFSDRYLSTIGVKISRKLVPLPEDDQYEDLTQPTAVQLLIWDVEGQTKFQRIAPSYLQGSSGSIVVADVTRPETIEHLRDHTNLVRTISPAGSIIVALNKADLIDPSELEKITKRLESLLSNDQCPLYWTSAKSGDNVDQIFTELSSALVRSTPTYRF